MSGFKKRKKLKETLKEKQYALEIITSEIRKIKVEMFNCMNSISILDEDSKIGEEHNILIDKIDFLRYKYNHLDIEKREKEREIFVIKEKMKEEV